MAAERPTEGRDSSLRSAVADLEDASVVALMEQTPARLNWDHFREHVLHTHESWGIWAFGLTDDDGAALARASATASALDWTDPEYAGELAVARRVQALRRWLEERMFRDECNTYVRRTFDVRPSRRRRVLPQAADAAHSSMDTEL